MKQKKNYGGLALASLLGLSMALVGCASKPQRLSDQPIALDKAQLISQMQTFVQRQQNEQEIVGLSVAVVDGQDIIWQQGFGYADKGNKIKATPKTRYRSGSISKLFNAIAVMQLQEQGALNIDKPLKNYLPAFSIHTRFGSTDGITPRSIMTHHSGLPGDWMDGMWAENSPPFSQMVADIKDEYVAYAPNTILSYSNLGVTLLGDAVQKIAGQPYADYMDKKVLAPMGMTRSHFERPIAGVGASKAYKGNKLTKEIPLSDLPAGGLNTTVEDLSRLAMMVNAGGEVSGKQILRPSTLAAMFIPQNADIALDVGSKIGLAWFLDEQALHGLEPVYAHGGSTIAHQSHFTVAPESQLAVIVLTNSEQARPEKIANRLLQMAWQSKKMQHLPKRTLKRLAETADLSGVYAGVVGRLEIKQKSSSHYRATASGMNLELKRKENGRFYARYRVLGILPISVGELSEIGFYGEHISGYDLLIGETVRGKFIAGTRVSPSLISAAWKQRLGRYKLLNPPAYEVLELDHLELEIDAGYLQVVLKSGEDSDVQLLKVISDNAAILDGLGRSLQETVRVVKEHGKEIMLYSGLRLQRVH